MLKYLVLFTILSVAMSQNCYNGCFECDSQNQICTACHEGFELTLLGGCVLSSIENCNYYANQNECSRCLPTYKLISNACVRDYSGCISSPDGSKCTECSSELALEDNVCVGVLNCKTYNGQCLECSEGFSLVNNICVADAKNCVFPHPLNGVCVQCRSDYVLLGYRCVSKLLYTSNCYYQNDKGECQICKDGYTNVAGSCYGNQQAKLLTETQPNQTGSSTPSTDSNTTALSKNTQLKSSEGIIKLSPIQVNQSAGNTQTPSPSSNNQIKSQFSVILSKLQIYCKQFRQNNVCGQCYPGFYVLSGYCLPIDPYCKTFNSTSNLCLECYKGYSVNSNKKCGVTVEAPKDPNCKIFQNENCLMCFPNYHIKLGVCIPDNPLCKGIIDGNCTSCYSGYIVKDGDCVVNPADNPNIYDPFCIKIDGFDCVICASGYFVNENGTCTPLSLNCLSHDRNGVCLECLTGYVMVYQRCVQQILQCQQYEASGNCSKCSTGFIIKGGICLKKDVTCSAYDNGANCIQCVTTYYLINGTCIYPSLGFDPLCTSYKNTYCAQCQKGSFLSNYRCVALDFNCQSFDQRSFRCLQCANGLRPRGIACI